MSERRRLEGTVTSDKMMKTVVVEVSHTYRHPLYQKIVHSTKKFMAQDDLGCKVGDNVLIVESKPLSHRKRWVVQKILKKSEVEGERVKEEQ